MLPESTTRGRRRPFLRGFSLLDLIVVIAILGIVARVALPRLSNTYARNRLDAAARRIVSDLALAQQRARQLSTPQNVQFDSGSSAYVLDGMSDPAHPASAYKIALDAAPYEVALAQVDFGGDEKLVFDGFGVPDSGGDVYLRLGGQLRQVTLAATTGRATISEPDALPAPKVKELVK